MKLSNLSSSQWKKIAQLISKKESLLQKVEAIDRQLAGFDGVALPAKSGVPAPAARRGGRKRVPGKLKDSIMKALVAAGPKGVKVGDIAEKLGVKPGNVFSWFYTTGKKNSAIKKVGEARYALVK